MNDLLEKLVLFFNSYDFDRLGHNFISDYKNQLQILDDAEKRGYAVRQEQEALQELIDGLDNAIKFSSEYNEDFGTYLM